MIWIFLFIRKRARALKLRASHIWPADKSASLSLHDDNNSYRSMSIASLCRKNEESQCNPLSSAITRVAHLTSAADQCERALAGGHLARPRFCVGVAWLAAAFSVYVDCRPRLTGCSETDDFSLRSNLPFVKIQRKEGKKRPDRESIAIGRRVSAMTLDVRYRDFWLSAFISCRRSVCDVSDIFVYISRVALRS